MRAKFLIALCSALTLCVEVSAEGDHEVRRGLFPYMAFIYYPDESVVDATGARFLRGAVLIRPEWLVTSAVGPSVVTDAADGFPRKTLLARLGAITIDANFTLNEDEDEQEREVIEIVRPYNHSATQWWRTDISLMKILLPFNLTSAVGIANINPKRTLGEKTCVILVFAKKDTNNTGERTLMQLYVELMPPSIENCGSHFSSSMTCAGDSDDIKNAVSDVNFCQGNSGGPLICENDVVGIQTYIDNDCKQPHLYQLLSAWENFISCGTEEKCHEEQCSHICDVADKDAPITSSTEKTTESSKEPTVKNEQTDSSPATEITSSSTVSTTDDSESTTKSSTVNLGPEEITSSTESSSLSDFFSKDMQSESDDDTSETTKTWPIEKEPDERRSLKEGDDEIPERKPLQAAKRYVRPPVRSASPSGMSHTLRLYFGVFILACLI